MKKRVLSLLFVLILCLAVTIPALATEITRGQRVVDNADLLTPSEESALLSRLDEMSYTYQADVVVVTVNSIGDKTPMEYADDYYDYNGYGMGENFDGLILLINMEGRDWWISTCGFCIDAFSDITIEFIGEDIVEYLSEGEYAEAFDVFANDCEYYLDGYVNGFPFPVGMTIIGSIIFGLIVALIGTGIMKSQLKSVRSQNAAADYVKEGSLNITMAREFFLYRTISRIAKPTDSGSGTHRSSSGRVHGGGGGKF